MPACYCESSSPSRLIADAELSFLAACLLVGRSAAFNFNFLPFKVPYPVPFRLLQDERKVGRESPKGGGEGALLCRGPSPWTRKR